MKPKRQKEAVWDGSRLKRAREDRQLSQTALGGLLEPPAPKQRIAEWERTGPRAPRLETVAQLAAALSASPGWLAFGESQPQVQQVPSPAASSGWCKKCGRIILHGVLLGYVLTQLTTAQRSLASDDLLAALRVHLRHPGLDECAACTPGHGAKNIEVVERLYRSAAYQSMEAELRERMAVAP